MPYDFERGETEVPGIGIWTAPNAADITGLFSDVNLRHDAHVRRWRFVQFCRDVYGFDPTEKRRE